MATTVPPATSTKKRLSPTVHYLLTGLVLACPAFLALGHVLPGWDEGLVLTPTSLAVIHLLILGFMLTVAFGVLYQLVPIAFQAPPVPRHVLYWHLPIHVASVLTMVGGFLSSKYIFVGIGGSVLLAGAAIYVALISRTFLRARNRTRVFQLLPIPVISLAAVIVIGLVQAFFPGDTTESLLLTHVVFGGFAFWSGLLLILSYKLFPMFVISHGYKASLVRTGSLHFTGVAALVVALWTKTALPARVLIDAGYILILLALVSFTVDVVSIVRARKKKRIVVALYDAMVAMGMFVLGEAGIAVSVMSGSTRWLYPAIFLWAFGGLMGLILSYMQKIVPFLWFEYRFSKRPERKTAPLIDDMVPKKLSQAGMGLYFLCVTVGTIAMILTAQFSSVHIAVIAWYVGILATVAVAVVFAALRYVLTIGGRRPEDDVEPAR